MDKDFRAGFASYSFSILLANFTKFATDELDKIMDVDVELRKLERTFLKLQEMVDTVEHCLVSFSECAHYKSLIAWLGEASRSIYNVNDILEDISLDLGLQEGGGKLINRKLLLEKFMLLTPRKISRLVKELQDLAEEMETNFYIDLVKQGPQLVVNNNQCYKFLGLENQTPGRESGLKKMTIGREAELKEVVEMLKHNTVPICITGMGGIGKSRFTHCLCEEVKESFKLLVWISISTKFDLVKIMRSAIESVSKKSCELIDLNALRFTLHNLLISVENFLVVLDNLNIEERDEWDLLYEAFKVESVTGKLIFTSQNSKVAFIIGAKIFRLPILSDADCWKIIKQRTFVHHESHNLEKMGLGIAKKCQGLPLVAKTIGDILQCLPDSEWGSFLKCNFWDLPQLTNTVFPIFLHSFFSLPRQIRKCLLYCCVFPPGYLYKRNELIYLWMAEGLIHPISGRRIEEIGELYFEELVCRSFFYSVSEDPHDFSGLYSIHEFSHHAYVSISSSMCQWIGENKSNCSLDTVRHLSICHGNVQSMDLQKFRNCDKLRTFTLLGTAYVGQCMPTLFEKFKVLRVLNLMNGGIKDVPNSIGNFKHLRYLNLSGNNISTLPPSVCHLSLLQVLILFNCSSLKCFPEMFSELTMLRHLRLDVNQIHEMPINFRRLENIQTLNAFLVEVRNGYTIEELRDLNFIRGSFCITGLENVANGQTAATGHLHEKQGIEQLELEWRSHPEDDKECDVLTHLRPHENLKQLIINYYHGTNFPTWLSDGQNCRLRSIHLLRCECCYGLPPLGELQFLEHLVIERMTLLKTVFPGPVRVNTFPSLKSLVLREVPELVKWGSCSRSCLQQLCNLTFHTCPKLGRLPEIFWFSSLQCLEVTECARLNYFPAKPASMKCLVICDSPALKRACEINGTNWSRVKKIPFVKIDGSEIPMTSQQA